jgi:hypothetical protein
LTVFSLQAFTVYPANLYGHPFLSFLSVSRAFLPRILFCVSRIKRVRYETHKFSLKVNRLVTRRLKFDSRQGYRLFCPGAHQAPCTVDTRCPFLWGSALYSHPRCADVMYRVFRAQAEWTLTVRSAVPAKVTCHLPRKIARPELLAHVAYFFC